MSTLPKLIKKKHATLIAFAENQLSPKSVSFSLPIASHPNLMQQKRVRPSFKIKKLKSACSQLNPLVSGLNYITIIVLFKLDFSMPTLTLSLLYKLTSWTLVQKVHYYFKKL